MAFEQAQVTLRFIRPDFTHTTAEGETVRGKQIIEQLRKNKQFQNDTKGKYVQVLYDGRPFIFREDASNTITVGKVVADCLRRSARIILGHGLNGPHVPFLEILREFNLGESPERPKFACPVCGEDQVTAPRFARHIAKEQKKHPEMFTEEVEEEAVTVPSAVPETDEDEG